MKRPRRHSWTLLNSWAPKTLKPTRALFFSRSSTGAEGNFILTPTVHAQKVIQKLTRRNRRALKKSGELAAAEERLQRQESHPASQLRPSAMSSFQQQNASVPRALQAMSDELDRLNQQQQQQQPSMSSSVTLQTDPPALESSSYSHKSKPRSDSPQRPMRASSPPSRFGEESYYFVPGDDMGASMMLKHDASMMLRPNRQPNPNDTARLVNLVKSLTAENERLARERDEARKQLKEEQAKLAQQRRRFFAMFAALKANLEQDKSSLSQKM